MSKIEVYKDAAGDWRWKKTADNNRTVSASTEGFENKAYAVERAEAERREGDVLVIEGDGDEPAPIAA